MASDLDLDGIERRFAQPCCIDQPNVLALVDRVRELEARVEEYKREVERRDEYLAGADARCASLTEALRELLEASDAVDVWTADEPEAQAKAERHLAATTHARTFLTPPSAPPGRGP
jgi:hypothetical protein